LRQQLSRINLLNQITRAIADRQDLESIFRVVLRRLEDDLPVALGMVFLHDEKSDVLTVAAGSRRTQPFAAEMGLAEGATIPLEQTGLRTGMQGETVYMPDTGQVDAQIPRMLAERGLRSLMATPLMVEGKTFGILLFARPKERGFSSPEGEFLRSLSEHVALAAHQIRLHEDLRKNLERNILQKYSNLLYAQSNKDEKGNTRVRVLDLFDAAMGECEIPLDPQLSLIQNANRYAKLFQKANRAIPLIKEHLRRVDLEISEIHSQLDRLTKLAENSGKPGQNLAQLPEADMPRRIAEDSKLGSPSAGQLPSYPELISIKKSARIIVSSEGWEIWVGRNRRENDFLTFKLAKPDDFWFHVAEYGGSHVVLRNVDRRSSAPEQSLIEAAQLAAYFSQARNARKVEVHYTQRKHVSKPKGSKPGLVRLREHKTISVQPRCELEVKATPGTSKQCSKAEPFIME